MSGILAVFAFEYHTKSISMKFCNYTNVKVHLIFSVSDDHLIFSVSDDN